jgi:hypothetical protein
MSFQQKSRQIALSFVNMDDVVVARELSGNGMSILGLVGRSIVGTAVISGGLAARAALFGAQVAAKSARAATAAAKGVVPGADAAEEAMYQLDQRLGAGAERASFVASRGVEIGKENDLPPTDPILGDPWLGKRLDPGATWNTVLADSAGDLSSLAALPLTLTTATVEGAIASPAGQRVGKMVWDSVSSMIDSTTGTVKTGDAADRAETRAMILTMGATPLWLAFQDGVDLCEGLSRAALGDTRRLRTVLDRLIERLEASDAGAAAQTPARLLAALDAHEAIELKAVLDIGGALVEDSTKLAKLGAIYSTLLTRLVDGSVRSAIDAGSKVQAIEAWIKVDDERRAAGLGGADTPRPAMLERLETIASAGTTPSPNRARAFFAASTIDLARDMVFSYSIDALGREAALARIERLFGREVRERIADDCSLRDDVIDAGRERDRRIGAIVVDLLRRGRARLRQARDHAAARLATLTANSRDNLIERLIPLRVAERAAVLRRFVAMADTANALDGIPSEERSRERVVARFHAWVDAGPDERPVLRIEAV